MQGQLGDPEPGAGRGLQPPATRPSTSATASPKAKLAVLANDITWNAYNNFGGRSNYINAEHLPATPVVIAPAVLLSARWTF